MKIGYLLYDIETCLVSILFPSLSIKIELLFELNIFFLVSYEIFFVISLYPSLNTNSVLS